MLFILIVLIITFCLILRFFGKQIIKEDKKMKEINPMLKQYDETEKFYHS